MVTTSIGLGSVGGRLTHKKRTINGPFRVIGTALSGGKVIVPKGDTEVDMIWGYAKQSLDAAANCFAEETEATEAWPIFTGKERRHDFDVSRGKAWQLVRGNDRWPNTMKYACIYRWRFRATPELLAYSIRPRW